RALLLAGSYSGRDRDEEQAPFIVETAQALDELKASGAIGIALRWSPGAPPPPDATRAVAALCAAHPGPAPVLAGGEGEHGDRGGRDQGARPAREAAGRAARRDLQEPDADAAGPGGPPPEATVHARLPQHCVHGLRRAARGPAVPRRSRHGGWLGAPRRDERHGDRASERPRYQG